MNNRSKCVVRMFFLFTVFNKKLWAFSIVLLNIQFEYLSVGGRKMKIPMLIAVIGTYFMSSIKFRKRVIFHVNKSICLLKCKIRYIFKIRQSNAQKLNEKKITKISWPEKNFDYSIQLESSTEKCYVVAFKASLWSYLYKAPSYCISYRIEYLYPPSLFESKLIGFQYKFTARCSFLMYHEENFFFFSYNNKSADVNITLWIALADRPYLRHIHSGNYYNQKSQRCNEKDWNSSKMY